MNTPALEAHLTILIRQWGRARDFNPEDETQAGAWVAALMRANKVPDYLQLPAEEVAKAAPKFQL
jgi:hypothetical protein